LRLNTQLFTRGPQGVALTTAGTSLLRHVSAMQRSAASIDVLLREFDSSLEGRVKLRVPDGIGAFWLAPRIPAFQRQHPGIALSIDAGISPDYPVWDDIDLNIHYDEQHFADHTIEPLGSVHFAPFATQEYLDLHGEPLTQVELLNHRTIQLSSQQLQKETWDAKAEAARTLSAYDVETNSSAVLVMAVLASGGIAFMPTCGAAFIPNLVMLGQQPSASTTLFLSYDPNVGRIARAERVIEWIKAMFDARTNPWFEKEFVHPRHFPPSPEMGNFNFVPPSSS
jgi:DNA-binding transcriptional LysR family regulator